MCAPDTPCCRVNCAFLFVSARVAEDDARIYPASPVIPQPFATSPAAIFGPAFDPLPSAVTQTIDGITLSVRPRYADLHRVVLTYTISGPTQPYPYEVGLDIGIQPTLALDGTAIPPFVGLGFYGPPYRPWLSLPSGEVTPNEGGISFDMSTLASLPPTITLHLTMPILVNNTPYIPSDPVPTLAPGAQSTPTPLNTVGLPLNKSLLFKLDLTTRTDNLCRIAQPAATTNKSGVTMTLDAVSITASETRLYVSFSGIYNNKTINNFTTTGSGGGWTASGTMDTGPNTAQLSLWEACESITCPPFTGFHYREQSLIDAPESQWLLKVDNLYDEQGSTAIPGPWVLKFDMPAATVCASLPILHDVATPTVTAAP